MNPHLYVVRQKKYLKYPSSIPAFSLSDAAPLAAAFALKEIGLDWTAVKVAPLRIRAQRTTFAENEKGRVGVYNHGVKQLV